MGTLSSATRTWFCGRTSSARTTSWPLSTWTPTVPVSVSHVHGAAHLTQTATPFLSLLRSQGRLPACRQDLHVLRPLSFWGPLFLCIYLRLGSANRSVFPPPFALPCLPPSLSPFASVHRSTL